MKNLAIKALVLILVLALPICFVSCGEDNENSVGSGSDISDLVTDTETEEVDTLSDDGWSPIFRP